MAASIRAAQVALIAQASTDPSSLTAWGKTQYESTLRIAQVHMEYALPFCLSGAQKQSSCFYLVQNCKNNCRKSVSDPPRTIQQSSGHYALKRETVRLSLHEAVHEMQPRCEAADIWQHRLPQNRFKIQLSNWATL